MKPPRPRLRDVARWRAHPPFLRQTTAVLNDPAGALHRYPMVLYRGGWPGGS
jgi:hypothetical protein